MKIAVSGYKCLNDINEYVEITDITIITGKNSSGKTSFGEAFEFLSIFMTQKSKNKNFFEWFNVSINSNDYAKFSTFTKGILDLSAGVSFGINNKLENQTLCLNFKLSDDGYLIYLNSIELIQNNTTTIKVNKKSTFDFKNYIQRETLPIINEFSINLNLPEILVHSKEHVLKSIKTANDFLNQEVFSTDTRHYNYLEDWVEYTFYQKINESLNTNENYTNKLLPICSEETIRQLKQYKKINPEYQIKKNTVFENFIIQFEIHISLEVYKKNLDIEFTNKIIQLIKEKPQIYIRQNSGVANQFDFFNDFQLSEKNSKYFSDVEIKHLKNFWDSTSTKELVASFLYHNKLHTNITDPLNSSIGIYISRENSSFPQADISLVSLINEGINSCIYPGNEINSEIWHHACANDQISVQNLFEAYLYLEHSIYKVGIPVYDEDGNMQIEYELEINSNTPLSLGYALTLEHLGQSIINNFKTEKKTLSIDNYSFIESWNRFTLIQKISFKNYYYEVILERYYAIFQEDPIMYYTQEYKIAFEDGHNNSSIDIVLKDKLNNTIQFNQIGSGHASFISLILNVFHSTYYSLITSSSPPFFILVEPERFLHPNMMRNLTKFIIDTMKINFSYINHNYGNLTCKLDFLIETHSEYLIRNIQESVATHKSLESSVIINYFEKSLQTNNSLIKQIVINSDGSLNDEFGSGFLDETELIIRNILNARLK